MTKGAEMEILTSTAIGSQLKRQSANDYLQELYRAKRHKNKSFDFQALSFLSIYILKGLSLMIKSHSL